MSILTLLTDFGIEDGFVGVMKGVIWGICPEVQIVDITHHIQPQKVKEGALTLSRVAPFFGDGTVHVAVVDPGVGTRRRSIAAQLGMQFCVAPDNGLLTLVIQDAQSKHLPIKLIELNNPDYWLNRVSGTFHGRDIFAPVGAHLAAGLPIEKLGTLINDPVLLDFPKAIKREYGWEAHITLIDHFGNLRTDLRADKIQGEAQIRISGREIDGIVGSYAHRAAGDLVAIADSGGYLEIALVNGNAAKSLGARIDDSVKVVLNG